MAVTFSEWLKSIKGTEREAEIESAAMDAECQREMQEDLLCELYYEREYR